MPTADSMPRNQDISRLPPVHGRIMSRHVVFASIFMMAVSAEAVAQSSTLGELEKRLEEMRSQIVAMQNRIAELEAATGIAATSVTTGAVPSQSGALPAPASQLRANEAESREAPTAFQYKGLSLTPGGFLEGTTLFRTRNQ